MSDLEMRLLDWWLKRREVARWYSGEPSLGPPAYLRMSCYHADLDVKLSLLETGRIHKDPE